MYACLGAEVIIIIPSMPCKCLFLHQHFGHPEDSLIQSDLESLHSTTVYCVHVHTVCSAVLIRDGWLEYPVVVQCFPESTFSGTYIQSSIKCISKALFTSANVTKCNTETQPKTPNSKKYRCRMWMLHPLDDVHLPIGIHIGMENGEGSEYWAVCKSIGLRVNHHICLANWLRCTDMQTSKVWKSVIRCRLRWKNRRGKSRWWIWLLNSTLQCGTTMYTEQKY
jgi:hypothetical protein